MFILFNNVCVVNDTYLRVAKVSFRFLLCCIKRLRTLWVALLLVTGINAQQIKIGGNAMRFDSSAVLEIESQKLGLLLPRINDTAGMVKAQKDGALIYFNNQPAGGLNKGLYVRSGAKWNFLLPYGVTSGTWGVSGNAGTMGNQHFVGTTNNRPLLFKTNNVTRFFIDSTTGYIGLGAAQPAATLDNRGSTLFGVKTLPNFPVSDSLGYSTSTVDSFTMFQIMQTTANIAISLPRPSRKTAGRIIIVSNTGTVPVTVASSAIAVNTALSFIWTGGQWAALGDGVATGNFSVPNKYISPGTLGMMQGAAVNTTAQDNIAIGYNALNTNIAGTRNVALGAASMERIIEPYSNVGIGSFTLALGTTGNRNVAVGYKALYNSRADSLVAIGANSLAENTTGRGNTAVGSRALNTNTIGNGNTAAGTGALGQASAIASFNTVMGYLSGDQLASSYNTAFGSSTLRSLGSGSNYNTAIGFSAGYRDPENSRNTTSSVKNSTGVGPYCQMIYDNTIIIGAEPSSHAVNVGVGVAAPGYKLHVNGIIAATGVILITSDGRLKKNVHSVRHALQKVLALRGISFQWNQEATAKVHLQTDSLTNYGFIAQEVEKVLPLAVVTGTDSFAMKMVDYDAIVPVVAAAIREQQPVLDNLERMQSDATEQIKQIALRLKRVQLRMNEKRTIR